MNVKFEVQFDADEIRELVREKCSSLPVPVPGEFRVSCKYGYIPEVIATFVPREAEEAVEQVAVPLAPATAQEEPL